MSTNLAPVALSSEVPASAVAPIASVNGVRRIRDDDDHLDQAELAEYKQFQAFKRLLKLTGPATTLPSRSPSPTPAPRTIVPEHLGNPQYIYQEAVSGYLSKQFPTIGNPAPLGLCGFALTTFVLSMFNAGAGVATGGPQGVVMGLALFYGGFIQLLAGMWEMRTGNTFGAVAFSSYGGFWMSFAALFIKSFGFMDVYAEMSPEYIGRALGIYLFSWCLFSLLMMVASHRTTVVLFTLFGVVALTFLLLSIGHWGQSVNCIQAGGAVGILAAAIAWYAALASLLTKTTSFFTLWVGDLTVPTRPALTQEQIELVAQQQNNKV